MSSKEKFALVVGILAAVGILLLFATFRWTTVQGSERVVWQTLGGVRDDVSEDGIHVYFGWTTTPHTYYIGSDTFIIDDTTITPDNDYMDKVEMQFNQPDVAPVEIPVTMERLTLADIENGKTTGPTKVILRCVMQFHLDPTKLVILHKAKTKAFRTTFLKDVLLQTIIDSTTILDARTVYQGAGRVALQRSIEKSLQSEPRFEEYGIIVERFVVRDIKLVDQKFLEMITAEAQAEQKRKTAMKEQLAADAEAEKAKSVAMAEQNTRLVEAATLKGEEIAKAEAAAAKEVLAAEADAKKVVLAAGAAAKKVELAAEAAKIQVTLGAEAEAKKDELEGEGLKLRKIAEAEGVLALGKAEAEAKKLMLVAYEGEGGQRFAQVEISKYLGQGIQKVYYVPSDMSINAIASDFQNAITVGLPGNTKK
jgi:hypothetical protein